MTKPLPVTGNTEQTKPENRAHYPALDGLRAIAFLMVFFQHYLYLPWGWAGVNVFFVLSGFLITGILFDTADSPHRARNFYMRRALRIFPLYYGVIALVVLAYPVFHWRWSIEWLAWPLYLGIFLRFLSPQSLIAGTPQQQASDGQLFAGRGITFPLYFGHFWSLCIEELFYLLWPWAVFSVRRRRTLLWICGASCVLILVVRIVALRVAAVRAIPDDLLYGFTPLQADSLLMGGFAALVWRGPHRNALLRWARFVAPLLMAVAVGYYCFCVLPSQQFATMGYQYPTWRYTFGLEFVNLLATSVVVCLLAPQKWLSLTIGSRPARWLGRISYGAYVFHDILHNVYLGAVNHVRKHVVIGDGPASFTFVSIALTGTILLAWLSFRFYESRFLNLKEKYTLS